MKNFGLIYRLSVIPYLGFLISYFINTSYDFNEYLRLSYRLCHIFIFLSAAALVYQLIYIIFLRKKENVSLGFSFATLLLYIFIGVSGLIAVSYIYFYFAGYKHRSIGFGQIHQPEIYFGLEAWKNFNENWLNPWLFMLFTAVYAVIYTKKTKSKNSNKE